MSFDFMISLAAVEYPLVVDHGVILVGYETLLVPVDVYDSGTAQFHLITATHTSEDGNTSNEPPGPFTAELGRRVLTTDIEQFRSMRCFLGWCEAAQVNLGAKHLPALIGYSGGRDKEKSKVLDGYAGLVQIGVTPVSPCP